MSADAGTLPLIITGGQLGHLLWRNAWHEFTPFLDHDIEIRTMICSTNAILVAECPPPATETY